LCQGGKTLVEFQAIPVHVQTKMDLVSILENPFMAAWVNKGI
jgi:hypothetical protein